MGVIYLRTNTINGMQYVGQTKNIIRRNRNWNNTKFSYSNKLLTEDRNKYGVNNWDLTILKECDDSELDKWEKYYIKEFNTIYPNGYNDNEGGSIGFHHSEKTKQQISQTEKGKIVSQSTIDKLSKPIVEITSEGEIIEWPNARECHKKKGFSYKVISQVCHHLKKGHRGSIFFFKDEYLQKRLGN